MNKRIIFSILILSFLSCKTDNINKSKNPHLIEIIDSIVNKEMLKVKPSLIIDGYDFNYDKLKPNQITFYKNQIGLLRYNKKENRVTIITKLSDKPKDDILKHKYLINEKEVSFFVYKNTNLENVYKKASINNKDLIKETFSLDADWLHILWTK